MRITNLAGEVIADGFMPFGERPSERRRNEDGELDELMDDAAEWNKTKEEEEEEEDALCQ